MSGGAVTARPQMHSLRQGCKWAIVACLIEYLPNYCAQRGRPPALHHRGHPENPGPAGHQPLRPSPAHPAGAARRDPGNAIHRRPPRPAPGRSPSGTATAARIKPSPCSAWAHGLNAGEERSSGHTDRRAATAARAFRSDSPARTAAATNSSATLPSSPPLSAAQLRGKAGAR